MITCTWETGENVHLRHAVVDALIIDKNNNQILLTRRAAFMYNAPGMWCLPGGYMDRDETVSQAVVREVREETGYNSKVVELLFINTDPALSTERQNIGFFFVMEALEKVGEPDREVAEMQWFPLDQLPPSKEIAFRHEEIIQMYQQHRAAPTLQRLPLMNL